MLVGSYRFNLIESWRWRRQIQWFLFLRNHQKPWFWHIFKSRALNAMIYYFFTFFQDFKNLQNFLFNGFCTKKYYLVFFVKFLILRFLEKFLFRKSAQKCNLKCEIINKKCIFDRKSAQKVHFWLQILKKCNQKLNK